MSQSRKGGAQDACWIIENKIVEEKGVDTKVCVSTKFCVLPFGSKKLNLLNISNLDCKMGMIVSIPMSRGCEAFTCKSAVER